MRVWLVVGLLLSVAGCLGEEAPVVVEPGAVGPAWSFVSSEGEVVSRDSPEGNATVLFFMATWCSTCRSMTPMVAEVESEFAVRGVRVFSVSIDPSDSDEALEGWREKYGQSWPHGRDEAQSMQRSFGVTSQSSVVVLDSDGNLVERWGFGRASGPEVRAALEGVLSSGAA